MSSVYSYRCACVCAFACACVGGVFKKYILLKNNNNN